PTRLAPGRGAILPGTTKCAAAAGAAGVHPQPQAGPSRRSAMDERIAAKRAVPADQPRRDALDEIEARPPYQRAIAEHPEVAFGSISVGEGCRRHFADN